MAIQAAERKSTIGLRDLYVAEVTQDDDSAYAADSPVYFAPAISASIAPAVNQKTQYADDGPYDVMTGEGETKIDLEVTGIPLEMLAKVLGKVYDAATGRMFDNGGTPPDMALSFRAKKSNGSYRYIQYLKGKFSAPNAETSTDTDTPDPKTAKITYTAVRTLHQFDLGDINDGVKGVSGDEDATNFSATGWFSSVQVPSAGSPGAFTVSSSPADDATGVAVDANVVLTFSNALAGNAEKGITLINTDTGAAVAVARTLDAARKVVTLNPSSNLAGTSDFAVVIHDVTDVYGQALADTVVTFQTV